MAGGPVRATIGLEYPPGSEFRDLFLITELLDSKAESDDVGLERSWLGCPVRSSGLSGLLKSSKKPPLIHQTEARLIRRYSGYLDRGRTHAARVH